ncbi:MAG: lytic transglycosylase domain-containing protein [Eubacteriales bacterium]|nr:lytic transglycosylase domain-containing protein [Eubacteriales bacterium]
MRKFSKSNFERWLVVILALIVIVIFMDDATTFLRRAYPKEYYSYIEENAGAYDIDPYMLLALIKAESGFDKDAVSERDAKGLMQLSDSTAFWAAGKLGISDFEVGDLFEPETNIIFGSWYYNSLMSEFDGNIILALAAYNAGSGKVKEWIEDDLIRDEDTQAADIPYNETRIFVKRVLNYSKIYHKLYDKNYKNY